MYQEGRTKNSVIFRHPRGMPRSNSEACERSMLAPDTPQHCKGEITLSKSDYFALK